MVSDRVVEYGVVGIGMDEGGERFRNGFGPYFVDFPWFWKGFDG